MGTWESLWRKWGIVGNSKGYSSPVFSTDKKNVAHCFVKVGDELRHARYHGGQWEDFASVGGGRFNSDPVAIVAGDSDFVEVYGVGLDGQLARNAWDISASSWKGWDDLGKPVRGLLGTPAVEERQGARYVVVQGSDNRLYARVSADGGSTWGGWEQGDRLKGGQFTGGVSSFIFDENRGPTELVLAGRSMENEMASISMDMSGLGVSTKDLPWGKWGVVKNSSGYGSPFFAEDAKAVHCFVKVGDELRQARYHGGRWTRFESVGGGRLRSDPVVGGRRGSNLIELYGTGLDGQLAHNVWRTSGSSWKGWEDLGKPAPGILGRPAAAEKWSFRFVVVKGSDNRLYMRFSDNGRPWGPWEQGDKLKAGRITGEISSFIIDEERRSPELVVIGRSMEDELASISLKIT